MEKRKFDKLGIETSLLGFGCMRFPLDEKGDIEEVEAEKMIDLAIGNGVTYIDTAYPYHNGDSEPFVGRVLKKYNRESFRLATKLPVWNIHSQEEARELFESQLKRLDVDYVDFYLLHALDADKWKKVLEYHIIDMCEELRSEGKIKYLGFSFHDEFNVFEEIIKYHHWDFCQLQLNYMDMGIQAGQKGVDLANELGVPLVVMEPIKGGSLASLPEDVTKMFKDYNPEDTLASWALRYVGTLPGVKVILSGMSTLEQVEDNLKTFNHYQNLSSEELEIVNKVAETLHSRTQNGCTGCAYCMPCPFGVDIPSNFKYWNNCFVYDDEALFKGKYEKMADKAKASNCKECGACEKMCPQQLPIREDLKRVVKDFE
ncbi:aldo/keto reductase [Candidatus Stoquefichus sp. SB1]|uniref:aldo/keto reductase n=1 Tax=Candidatus Stoquefichus sp. SB1 TaxID=1658109 RepID=UPI00067F7242|nr:aldo/keto reductase [Candidatus Stoquefichus sp. SB1]